MARVKVLRWILILPVAVADFYAAFFIGLAALNPAFRFCPEDQIVSGFCTAPWWDAAVQVVIAAGAGLAAGLIVLTSTLLAPSHQREVTIAVFLVGAAIALVVGISDQAYWEMVTSILVGFIVAWLLRRRSWKESPPAPIAA